MFEMCEYNGFFQVESEDVLTIEVDTCVYVKGYSSLVNLNGITGY